MFFHETVNRITSRDYNPISDTDFTSLVRYDRFPSLLYCSGATFLKIGLWYGGAASSFIPIFSVYIIFPTIFFGVEGGMRTFMHTIGNSLNLNVLLLAKKVDNLLHMGSRQAKVLEVSEVCPSHDCCYQHSLIWLDDYQSYWYW